MAGFCDLEACESIPSPRRPPYVAGIARSTIDGAETMRQPLAVALTTEYPGAKAAPAPPGKPVGAPPTPSGRAVHFSTGLEKVYLDS